MTTCMVCVPLVSTTNRSNACKPCHLSCFVLISDWLVRNDGQWIGTRGIKPGSPVQKARVLVTTWPMVSQPAFHWIFYGSNFTYTRVRLWLGYSPFSRLVNTFHVLVSCSNWSTHRSTSTLCAHTHIIVSQAHSFCCIYSALNVTDTERNLGGHCVLIQTDTMHARIFYF